MPRLTIHTVVIDADRRHRLGEYVTNYELTAADLNDPRKLDALRSSLAVAEELERLDAETRRQIATCAHDFQEQPGEPPRDVCNKCGLVRE